MSNNEILSWIRQSSPYIRAHRDKTFVINIPGEAVSSPEFTQLIHDLALLNAMGIKLVICHGARPQIEEQLSSNGIQSQYINGIRVTDSQTLTAVIQASCKVRLQIESLLSMGLANSVMAGAEIRVVSGNFVTARPVGVRDGVDFLYTGTVRSIDAEGLQRQVSNGNIVVLSPIGYSPTGEVFNITAEEINSSTAQVLNAEKAVFITNRAELPKAVRALREIELADAKRLLDGEKHLQTRHNFEVAIAACENGVRRVHFLDMQKPGALLLELFTRDGSGMMISADLYEDLRQARIDDVGGILELIAPLEEKGILVRRSRQKLETEISHFLIMERDGMIIACAAYFPFKAEKVAELACLAVHSSYLRTGRGQALLTAVEKRARMDGIEQLFVLTTQTSHWFLERGFIEKTVQDLRVSNQQTYNFKRNSKVLVKVV